MQNFIASFFDFVLGWPLIIYVLGTGVICTLALRFIQVRHFFTPWTLIFGKKKEIETTGKKVDMTPMQAFINTLSANLGNASIAGMATAIYAGGPGSALWVLIIGILLMSVRFAEVFLSVYFGMNSSKKDSVGGPMLYLQSAIGGRYLAATYAFLCTIFSLLIGNAMQTNSIRISVETTWGISPFITAAAITAFVIYVITGGARRVAVLSDSIVPLKVIVFIISTTAVLAYHYDTLLDALKLIVSSAFSPLAVAGGALGFTVQQAMRFGIIRSIYATESGLGTAAILYGATGSTQPTKEGISSMLSTLISTVVCFIVALCIVASGAWKSGLTSTALTIEAFKGTFGWLAGWVVSFLSISFGVGVLVTFSYVAREAWMSVTGNRFARLYDIVFCLFALMGALVDPSVVFGFGDIINGSMLSINLFGILCLLPLIRTYLTQQKEL